MFCIKWYETKHLARLWTCLTWVMGMFGLFKEYGRCPELDEERRESAKIWWEANFYQWSIPS